jgi:hypothetical protein
MEHASKGSSLSAALAGSNVPTLFCIFVPLSITRSLCHGGEPLAPSTDLV